MFLLIKFDKLFFCKEIFLENFKRGRFLGSIKLDYFFLLQYNFFLLFDWKAYSRDKMLDCSSCGELHALFFYFNWYTDYF